MRFPKRLRGPEQLNHQRAEAAILSSIFILSTRLRKILALPIKISSFGEAESASNRFLDWEPDLVLH
jgi:hypothetical protein